METLKLKRDGSGLLRVTMARPEVFNAFNEQMIFELSQVFRDIDNDAAIRAIVLAGEGKVFSAGADLQWMKRASEASFEWNLNDAAGFAEMLHLISSSTKPTIARIQGQALGGGVGLACACDIAIAADDAKFAVSETRFGILPSVIGPYLTNAVGKRQALRLALTARRISAAEALQIGLVQAVVPAAELDESVANLVSEMTANGPAALAETKLLYRQMAVGPVTPEVRELTARTIARVRGTEEAREGFDAFLSKRPPAWSVR